MDVAVDFARSATEMPSEWNGIPVPEIRAELDRILRSRVFIHSHRIRRFLQFVVEECLLNQQHRLKEYLIGLEVFNRQESFDPRVDSIVRVEARRLRAKLDVYYATDGRDSRIRIQLRKGSYVPEFEFHQRRHFRTHPELRTRRAVALQPLTGLSDDPIDAAFAEEVRRTLVHSLVCRPNLQVAAPGSELAPDILIRGSVERQDGRTQLHLEAVTAAPEHSYLWSDSVEAAHLDGLAQDFAGALDAAEMPCAAAYEPRRRSAIREAQLQYVEGRRAWRNSDPARRYGSAAHFRSAVESDPEYAAAWAGLAQAILLGCMYGSPSCCERVQEARDACARALDLDESLAEAQLAAGVVSSLLDWDWKAADRHFRRALRLDSSSYLAHLLYGLQLAVQGDMEGARKHLESAADLDPAAPGPHFALGWLNCAENHFAAANEGFLLLAQFEPDYPLAYLGLGWACAGQRRFEDASAHLATASALLGGTGLAQGALGYCEAMAGRRETAQRLLNQALASGSAHSFTSAAAICAGLGDSSRALEHLDQAISAHEYALPLLLPAPEFAGIRASANYSQLRSRLRLD